MATNMSKKRKFVADGVFYAELNELLTQELAEEGYAGVEVRVTPLRTEIIISATRPQNVLGEKGQRIRELTSVVQKRCVNPSLYATFARVLPHFSSAGRFPFYPGWLTPFFTTDFCATVLVQVDCCCGSRTHEPPQSCLRYRATAEYRWLFLVTTKTFHIVAFPALESVTCGVLGCDNLIYTNSLVSDLLILLQASLCTCYEYILVLKSRELILCPEDTAELRILTLNLYVKTCIWSTAGFSCCCSALLQQKQPSIGLIPIRLIVSKGSLFFVGVKI